MDVERNGNQELTSSHASKHSSDIRSTRFKHTRIICFFCFFLKIRPKIRRVVKVMQRTIIGPQSVFWIIVKRLFFFSLLFSLRSFLWDFSELVV